MDTDKYSFLIIPLFDSGSKHPACLLKVIIRVICTLRIVTYSITACTDTTRIIYELCQWFFKLPEQQMKPTKQLGQLHKFSSKVNQQDSFALLNITKSTRKKSNAQSFFFVYGIKCLKREISVFQSLELLSNWNLHPTKFPILHYFTLGQNTPENVVVSLEGKFS